MTNTVSFSALPVDAEADARIEDLIARNTKTGGAADGDAEMGKILLTSVSIQRDAVAFAQELWARNRELERENTLLREAKEAERLARALFAAWTEAEWPERRWIVEAESMAREIAGRVR